MSIGGRDLGEFKRHWRPLLAASLGMGSALSLNTYILSIFAPYLLKEFGWSRSEWALLGLVQIAVMVTIPIIGRLTDVYGVRRIAAVGAFSYPVFLLAIAGMNGSLGLYFAIYVAQTIICSTTTATVYSRVVVAAFKAHRGLALAVMASGPAAMAAVLSPTMSSLVAHEGWRLGYVIVAGICAACALATFLLLGSRDAKALANANRATERNAAKDYGAILTMPVFWMMFAGFAFVNLPFSLAASQLKLVVLDQGLSDAVAATMVATFAVASIVGRLVSGAALDRFPTHIVAAVGFILPVIGLLLLASPFDSFVPVFAAVALLGVAFGGEGDVLPYLVGRYFNLSIFSTVLGLQTAAVGGSMALGNLVIAAVLSRTGSYNAYLLTAAATAFVGSVLFLMLGLRRFRRAEEVDPVVDAFA